MDKAANNERQMACAVCGWPLEDFADLDGTHVEWVHARGDDHLPVPVDPSEIRVNHRCDFCDGEPVTAIVIVTTFESPDRMSVFLGNWAACTDCGELIRRGRWSQLVTRVRSIPWHAAHFQPRRGLEELYGRVRAHYLGIISLQEWLERVASAEA